MRKLTDDPVMRRNFFAEQCGEQLGAVEEIAAGKHGRYGAVEILQEKMNHVIVFINQNERVSFVDSQIEKVVTLNPSVKLKLGTSTHEK